MRILISFLSAILCSMGHAKSISGGVDEWGIHRQLDSRSLGVNGSALVSGDGKAMTNLNFRIHPNNNDVFSDDYWGYPGITIISTKGIFADTAAVSAHHYAIKILEHFKKEFGWDSFDGRGSTLVTIIHGGNSLGDAQGQWTGKYIALGDGDGKKTRNTAAALDVIVHEFSHGVIASSSKLGTEDEPGALNESFADIMGIYANYKIQPERFSFDFGKDLFLSKGEAIRNIADPQKFENVDHYSNLYSGIGDSGGVHDNCGISSLAFYLFSKGGKHPTRGGKEIKGVGLDVAAHIFFTAFVTLLKADSNFIDARRATIQVSTAYSASVQNSLLDAWEAVGVPEH